jgi:TIR domain
LESKTTCFISYTWHSWQKNFADLFANELRKQSDFDVWIDREEILPSQRLNTRLEEGLGRESDCIILLMSSEYLQSENCLDELNRARELWIQRGKPLIPVRIGPCEMPFSLRDIVFVDLSRAVDQMGRVDSTALAQGVDEMADKVRKALASSSDLLRFFDPGFPTAVRLVTNKSYVSPFAAKKGISTTTRFVQSTEEILQILRKRGAITSYSHFHLEYLEPPELKSLMDGPDDVITYASSKINVVTDQVLRQIESAYKLNLRFVFEDDLVKGLRDSSFPDFTPARRVALVLKDATLKYGIGKDYGLLVRAPIMPRASKVCWVVAGCGRPGSSAVYRALFDPSWKDVLWPRLSPKLPTAFYAVLEVDYDLNASDAPINPSIFDFRVF